jgi:hypothetical protein
MVFVSRSRRWCLDLRDRAFLDREAVKQVMKKTRARIFRGDTRSKGKLLSIFEPSTEIIRKGKAGKPNEFGKVVKIQKAKTRSWLATRSTINDPATQMC